MVKSKNMNCDQNSIKLILNCVTQGRSFKGSFVINNSI